MKGKPRTPTSILEAKGSFNVNPERRRIDPPTDQIPANMRPPAKTVATYYRRILRIAPQGVIRAPDEPTVHAAAGAWFDHDHAENAGERRRAAAALDKHCGKLGMTPVDRARVATPVPTGEDHGQGIARFLRTAV